MQPTRHVEGRTGRSRSRRLLAAITAGAVLAATSGCSRTEITVPEAGDIPVPTLQTTPVDLAASPQLQVLVARDTAGIVSEEASTDGTLLPLALAALAASADAPRELSRLSIFADSVYFTYEERGIDGRSVNAVFRRGEALSVSDPSYDDQPTYPISAIEPDVPQAVIDAIRDRLPDAVVTGLDLTPARSATYGLAWSARISDARGSLATVYADPGGAIVGVDLD